ncbi:MAG: C25 family cysteine peptidase, partial [bacterium]
DYYYANLDTPDWDLDGDNRWGEFDDDDFDTHAEVIVGRIPVDNAATVATICENIVAFERDVGGWKRSALLAHGTMDYRTPGVKSDQAVLAERLKTDFFGPLGYTTHTLYEEGGIDPSTYASDDSLCQANYENNCGLGTHGVVSCNAHGAVDRFVSYYWSGDWDGDGKWDPDGDTPELGSTEYSQRGQISAHPVSAITMLTGCNTAAIVGDDSLFAASTLRSRYLVRIPRDNTLAEVYLNFGAPATIGPTAGGDYSGPEWAGPEDKHWNTLSYFFFEHLLDEDKKAGDAFYQAQQDYADQHPLQRGIRDFNFFGDPSVRLKGVDDRPGGADRIVYEGTYQYYAADNDDNGDMYVGVITTEQDVAPGEIRVYKSANHGEGWYLWSIVPTSDAVWTVVLLVSRYHDVALPDNRLHVVYSCRGGHVIDERIQLADSTDSDTTALPSAGRWAVHVSAARDPNPMPAPNTIYAVWEYDDWGTSKVRFAYSSDNGETWADGFTVADRNMPDVDAGPAGRVYVNMVIDAFGADPDVVVVRSADHGSSFGGEENLTAGDGSLIHYYPVVGASTHGSYPAV